MVSKIVEYLTPARAHERLTRWEKLSIPELRRELDGSTSIADNWIRAELRIYLAQRLAYAERYKRAFGL